MDTREGRETRVTSRIFWLITIVIIIVTNNKTTTSMRRKGLKVIRGFYQYFNHYCHHYHHQQQGPLLAGTASAWKWYRCMEEQGTRWRHERGERQDCPSPPPHPPPSSVTFFLSPTMQAAPSPPLSLSSSSISQWKKITSLHSNEIKTTPMYLQPNAPNIMRRMG